MIRRSIVTVVWVTLFLVLSFPLQAQESPHDAANDVTCTDCHRITYEGGMVHINVPRGAEQETTCKTCHNPDGQASGMSSVGNHEVNGGSILIDCTTCHNPHVSEQSTDPHTDITADNLSLIRSTIAESRVPGVLNPVIFQDPSQLVFAEGDPPYNGVCQACHTQTNHHTNDDSAAHDHEFDNNCLFCHAHAEGFGLSAAACGSCHGNPPDTGNHEIHFESANYHTGRTFEWDCDTCHANNTHLDNNVDVGRGYTMGGDPDNGYGTCTSACHTGAVWGGGSLYCNDCHGPNSNCSECHPGMPTVNTLPDDDPSFPIQVAPTLVEEPDIDSETAVEVTLEWDPLPPTSGGETQYYAVVSVNADLSSPTATLNWTAGASWTLTLDTSRAWYWRVKARDIARPGLESGWSSVDLFQISIPGTPLAPVLIPEPDVVDIVGATTLDWNPVSFSDPVEYYVEVDTHSLFSSPDFTSDWISATSWSFTPAFYAPYWWRVKTRNALDHAMESAWSIVDEFRIWSPSGSCPFLYVWDGEEFVFQSDMYGPGKLGTLSSRGYLKPNPHDYYILETNPVEKDDQYQMRLVEERFETDYMDELKLYVIDLPMHRRVYAEKPGFGGTLEDLQDVLHTASQIIQRPQEITHVNTGQNVSDLVVNSDGSYLVLNNDNNIDFTYQTLELDLGDLSQASQIKLIIDGMTVFPSTPEGVDRASQFGPRTKLEVLNGNGEWVSVPKTTAELPKLPEFKRVFALDISDIFLTDVYKVRLTFLFKTYVDAIHFDTTQNLALTLTEVPLLSAELRSYGLSDNEPIFDDIYNYLYRMIDPNHYHNYFPGDYTRYGDVAPLLSETEDYFVIYGQGDELDLRFDLAGPQPAGTYRAFLLYTNGYYKDEKVAVPHTVEPLPFKDMSNFPYDPAVENYPDDPAHNQYRAEYNTRIE